MDNLAHTLVGAALGEAGLKRRTALAMPTLLIGANLPDVDVLALLFGSGLGFRRGWTHGVLAIVVLPLILTGTMVLWDRWRRRSRPDAPSVSPRQILLLSYVAVLSHPFLDWLNTYGMRWLMPFDGTWFYGDALFIVDPWVWLMLLAGLIAARGERGVKAGRAAVAVTTVYIGLTLIGTGAGTMMVRAGMTDAGVRVDDLMVGPRPVNPFVREVIVRRGETYFVGSLRWLPSPRLEIEDRLIAGNWEDPVVRAAARYPEVQEFLGWARFPFYRIEPLGRGYQVILDDLRYSNGVDVSWAAVVVMVREPGSGGGSLTAATGSETAGKTGT